MILCRISVSFVVISMQYAYNVLVVCLMCSVHMTWWHGLWQFTKV